ncbi:MAG TPA: EamA/RhaT family transporter [Dehalococcoidia bacterium]|jgi:drug/metabolite transporter (DMT)-like permease
MDGLWIPLTVGAAFAQTLRNAAQRGLVATAGTLGATLVRFLFALPFAVVYTALVFVVAGERIPDITRGFVLWVLAGGLAQIAATALLLRVMEERNFAIGVAYSKTELIQVAVFAAVFLGDPLGGATGIAIVIATAGVLLLSPLGAQGGLRGLLTGWTSRSALLGIASGAGFAISATGYRGAALELEGEVSATVAAAYTLVWAQGWQVLVLGGYLLWRNAGVLVALFKAWRQSIAAGFAGAAASAGWFTAMAMEPVAHVRTLGLVELLFSLAIARRAFREHVTRIELAGMALLTVSLVLVTLAG